jgi:hypothetical protein
MYIHFIHHFLKVLRIHINTLLCWLPQIHERWNFQPPDPVLCWQRHEAEWHTSCIAAGVIAAQTISILYLGFWSVLGFLPCVLLVSPHKSHGVKSEDQHGYFMLWGLLKKCFPSGGKQSPQGYSIGSEGVHWGILKHFITLCLYHILTCLLYL